MGELSEIIQEIQRHKGVLLPNVNELGWYATQVYSHACEEIGLTFDEYHENIQSYVVSKYQFLLDETKKLYGDYPDARQFDLGVEWKHLSYHSKLLANKFRDGSRKP